MNYLIILSPMAVPLILYLVKGITTEVIHKCWVPCFSKVSISYKMCSMNSNWEGSFPVYESVYETTCISAKIVFRLYNSTQSKVIKCSHSS